MSPTKRLFDINSHQFTFDATVLSVEAGETGTLHIVLDATAFFPEGGGQYADPGTLGGQPVLDVQDQDGVITHTVQATDASLFAPGTTVEGVLDRKTRICRMQNHTAEHILSGIIHRRYGFANVGFHLGIDDVTLDFDGILTRKELDEIEDEANAIIRSALPVRATYPTPEVLVTLTYRSKLALTEGVRIVEIGDPDAPIDRCACCAPHVNNTAEIGLVKMLDFQHYKGGIRIHMLAGEWALADYRRRYTATATIAAALSVKQEDVVEGFERAMSDMDEKRHTIATLRGKLQAVTVAAIPVTDGSFCYFDAHLEAVEMRRLLNELKGKCGRLCGVFSGDDTSGYAFVIGRGDESLDLKAHIKEINAALSARGGGSSEMLQGSAKATRATIEAYFRNL